MYRFKMSIGDWSDDGHGKCENYIVESNFPVERVREAHFAMEGRTGISIENLCNEYAQDCIGEDDVELLKELGYEFAGESYEDDDGIHYYMTPEEMAHLWVFLLMKSDSELQLKIVDEDYPTLHFYGYDDQRRHIGQVGYGCFE